MADSRPNNLKRPAKHEAKAQKARKRKRSKRDKNIRALGTSDDILRADVQELLDALPAVGEQEVAPARDEEVEVTIEAISANGDGLGRTSTSSHRVFQVPFSVPGDVVKARVMFNDQEPVVHTKTNLVKIISPSPHRNDSLVSCRYFGECAGCSFQMLPYSYQLEHKKSLVVRAYRNFSGLDASLIPAVNETMGSPKQYGYRTKMTPHFEQRAGGRRRAKNGTNEEANAVNQQKQENGTKQADTASTNGEQNGSTYPTVPPIGFHYKTRREVLDIEECPLATKTCQAGLEEERSRVAKELNKYPRGATLLIRENTERYPKGQIPTSDSRQVVTEEQGDFVYAKDFVTSPKAVFREWVDDFQIRNVANSFFQNNNSILPAFIGYVRSQVQPQGIEIKPQAESGSTNSTPHMTHLVDAYCGCGIFSVMLSSEFESTLGIDIDQAAIEQARSNAGLNTEAMKDSKGETKQPTFLAADASHMFESMKSLDPTKTVIILDPPRKGCDENFLRQLLDFGPERIVYVSCNVHTQACDVGWLLRGGTDEVQHEDESEPPSKSHPVYVIESIQPMDFFPQTPHVETVTVLTRKHDDTSQVD